MDMAVSCPFGAPVRPVQPTSLGPKRRLTFLRVTLALPTSSPPPRHPTAGLTQKKLARNTAPKARDDAIWKDTEQHTETAPPSDPQTGRDKPSEAKTRSAGCHQPDGRIQLVSRVVSDSTARFWDNRVCLLLHLVSKSSTVHAVVGSGFGDNPALFGDRVSELGPQPRRQPRAGPHCRQRLRERGPRAKMFPAAPSPLVPDQPQNPCPVRDVTRVARSSP
jgi:hypothetical protein